MALQSLETLSHRTERLLQLSRAEGGDMAHFGPVNLAIVVRNLMDNALNHTDAAVELEVKSGVPATLVVRDHGRGLIPQQIAHIQQRHVRIDNQHVGYGLGMPIVRTIADKHGCAALAFISPPAGLAQGLEVQLIFAAG